MFLPGISSLPVIDRDEARFAQASVQMAETGDLMDIKFQDQIALSKAIRYLLVANGFNKITIK